MRIMIEKKKEKKLMLHKKGISCRQKQDDAAQKNILCSKKVLLFPEPCAILETTHDFQSFQHSK